MMLFATWPQLTEEEPADDARSSKLMMVIKNEQANAIDVFMDFTIRDDTGPNFFVPVGEMHIEIAAGYAPRPGGRGPCSCILSPAIWGRARRIVCMCISVRAIAWCWSCICLLPACVPTSPRRPISLVSDEVVLFQSPRVDRGRPFDVHRVTWAYRITPISFRTRPPAGYSKTQVPPPLAEPRATIPPTPRLL